MSGNIAENEYAIMQRLGPGQEDQLPVINPPQHCRYRCLPKFVGGNPQCAVLEGLAEGNNTNCHNVFGTDATCPTANSSGINDQKFLAERNYLFPPDEEF